RRIPVGGWGLGMETPSAKRRNPNPSPQRRSRMAVRSSRRIASALATRSSTSSRSAWRSRPDRASPRPHARARTSPAPTPGRGPPRAGTAVPSMALVDRDAGVRDEQIVCAVLPDPPLDVLAPRDVADEPRPSDLGRNRLDLLAGTTGDGDPHPGGREVAGN